MIAHAVRVQIDCIDPEGLSKFWSSLLELPESGRLGDPPRYLALKAADGSPIGLGFQRVPEAKITKNRVHLDIDVDDLEAATARVIELGGTQVADGEHDEFGCRWRIFRDPEGNEFCLEKQT